MSEESQREEMNAAVRGQRERRAVPRSMVPPEPDPQPPAAPAPPARSRPRLGLLTRLLGR